MLELAAKYRRYGYRRIHTVLKREGFVQNSKRTERIYRAEKLSLKIRRRKKLAAVTRIQLPEVCAVNQRWAMDFVMDSLCNGRRIRVLPIIDTYSRECLKIVVDTSIGGQRITRELNQLAYTRGLPEHIVVDNGPEFIGNALDEWAYMRDVKLQHIRPGKPVENAYIESFNGRLRDECLNEHWFTTLEHAKQIIEQWRQTYNQFRPHSSLNNLSPTEFIKRQELLTKMSN